MTRVVEFIGNHWQLWIAFVVVFVLLIFEEIRCKTFGILRLNPKQLAGLMNHDDVIVVDLRSANLYKEGHVLGSINIEADEIFMHDELLEYKEQSVVLLDLNENIAPKTSIELSKAGFNKVYILAGGINAWKNANMPLTKK